MGGQAPGETLGGGGDPPAAKSGNWEAGPLGGFDSSRFLFTRGGFPLNELDSDSPNKKNRHPAVKGLRLPRAFHPDQKDASKS